MTRKNRARRRLFVKTRSRRCDEHIEKIFTFQSKMRGNLSKSHSTCEAPCLCPEKLPIEVASVGKKESPFSQCVSFSLFRAVFSSLLLLLPGKMWSDKGWRDKNSKGKISFSSCLAVLSSLSQETMRENGRLVFDLR